MSTLRTLLAAFVLTFSSIVMADDYQYLTVTQSDGDTSFTVSDIQKITFDTTNMNLHLKDGSTQSLPLVNLQKMFFTGTASGIASLGSTNSKIHFEGGVLRADMAAGESLTIFNMKGEPAMSANKSGIYDLGTLVKGVYIVKVGSETKKVVNK